MTTFQSTFRRRLLLAFTLAAALPLMAWAAPATLVPGVDYMDIANGTPIAAQPGKVEVAEVFGYTCPFCANFEPLLREWKAQLPADVNVVSVPAPFGGYWIPYAQAFYAAQSMGLVDRSHAAMFRAIHEEHRLPIGGATPEAVAAFYADYGVDPAAFAKTMTSDPVRGQLVEARDFLMRSGVEATPTIIVAGKYRVLGKDARDMLRITDALVARERAAQPD